MQVLLERKEKLPFVLTHFKRRLSFQEKKTSFLKNPLHQIERVYIRVRHCGFPIADSVFLHIKFAKAQQLVKVDVSLSETGLEISLVYQLCVDEGNGTP